MVERESLGFDSINFQQMSDIYFEEKTYHEFLKFPKKIILGYFTLGIDDPKGNQVNLQFKVLQDFIFIFLI